jgi:hypothetical protein
VHRGRWVQAGRTLQLLLNATNARFSVHLVLRILSDKTTRQLLYTRQTPYGTEGSSSNSSNGGGGGGGAKEDDDEDDDPGSYQWSTFQVESHTMCNRGRPNEVVSTFEAHGTRDVYSFVPVDSSGKVQDDLDDLPDT